MNNLQQLRILVTRPESQGKELCRLISAHGGYPIHFPTIAFGPPGDKEAFQQSLKQLGEQDWLIFISPQAVYASIPYIRNHSVHLKEKVSWAAIGAGTAKALEDAGYDAILYPDKEQNSDALLALPEFQQVMGKKIAVIRGGGGRELVDKKLAERGARVLSVIAYERILPTVDICDCLNHLKEHTIDVIVCTSGEGMRNLKELLGESAWPYLQQIPMIVISERIKNLAKGLGFRRIWVTHHASDHAILDIMAEIRKAR